MSARVLVIISVLINYVSSRDVIQVDMRPGRKAVDTKYEAPPAIWQQTRNVTFDAKKGETISQIIVTDLRPTKDGVATVIEGGLGRNHTVIELKSPTMLRGFEYRVQIYTTPDNTQAENTTTPHSNTVHLGHMTLDLEATLDDDEMRKARVDKTFRSEENATKKGAEDMFELLRTVNGTFRNTTVKPNDNKDITQTTPIVNESQINIGAGGHDSVKNTNSIAQNQNTPRVAMVSNDNEDHSTQKPRYNRDVKKEGLGLPDSKLTDQEANNSSITEKSKNVPLENMNVSTTLSPKLDKTEPDLKEKPKQKRDAVDINTPVKNANITEKLKSSEPPKDEKIKSLEKLNINTTVTPNTKSNPEEKQRHKRDISTKSHNTPNEKNQNKPIETSTNNLSSVSDSKNKLADTPKTNEDQEDLKRISSTQPKAEDSKPNNHNVDHTKLITPKPRSVRDTEDKPTTAKPILQNEKANKTEDNHSKSLIPPSSTEKVTEDKTKDKARTARDIAPDTKDMLKSTTNGEPKKLPTNSPNTTMKPTEKNVKANNQTEQDDGKSTSSPSTEKARIARDLMSKTKEEKSELFNKIPDVDNPDTRRKNPKPKRKIARQTGGRSRKVVKKRKLSKARPRLPLDFPTSEARMR